MDLLKNSIDEVLAIHFSSYVIPVSEQVAEWGKHLRDWFWDERFWTPGNYSWEDLNPERIRGYPDSRDLLVYPLSFTLLMLLMKHFILMPNLLSPLTEMIGLPNKKHPPPVKNGMLQSLYDQYGLVLPKSVVAARSKTLQWSEREIQRWLRRRGESLKLTKHERFVDYFYSLVYKSLFVSFGLYLLIGESYIQDLKLCWKNYPKQAVSEGVWWYYMIGVSYFASQALSLFNHPIRSEGVYMLIHHVVASLLLAFSWIFNAVRMGSLTLLLHDVSDIFLLVGKLSNYLKWQRTTDVSLGFFIISWCTTRLYIFPMLVLKNLIFDIPEYIAIIPVMIVFEMLLLCIFTLNMKWTYNIANMVYKKVIYGVVEDSRSSDECENIKDK